MSNIAENETMNITIEEVEEEAASVESATIIDDELVHLLAKIAARNDVKNQKRRPLNNLLGVGILLLAGYFAYTYFVTKTNTERGPVIIGLLVIMAGILFWYVNQPITTFMEKRMKPYLGQAWKYTVTDSGVELDLNGRKGHFDWEEMRGWWLEDGYYLMEVGGQIIAVKQENLDGDEEAELKSLMYIYLGDALEIQN